MEKLNKGLILMDKKDQENKYQLKSAGAQLENEVIATYLSDPEMNQLLELEIKPYLFQDPTNKRIAQIIFDNISHKKVNTLGTIQTRFKELFQDNELIDLYNQKLKDLTKIKLSYNTIEDSIEKLKEYTLRNYLESQGRKLTAESFENPSIDEVNNIVKDTISTIYLNGKKNSIISSTETINKMLDHSAIYSVNYTGFNSIDNTTGGFLGGELITIGAPTGGGKSTLVLNIINHCTKEHAKVNSPITGALIFSFEMSDEEVIGRLISSNTMIPYKNISKRSTLDQNNREIIQKQQEILKKQNIFVDSDRNTIEDIENKARVHMLRHPYSLLVIDYIQIIPISKQGNRQQLLGEVSSRLKHLAKELQVTIIVLSQLTEFEKGMYRTREATDIENDSDFFFILTPTKGNDHIFLLSCKKARHFNKSEMECYIFHNGGIFRMTETNAPTKEEDTSTSKTTHKKYKTPTQATSTPEETKEWWNNQTPEEEF